MSYMWTIFVALLCVNSVLCKTCEFKDSECVVRWANSLYPSFIKGAGIIKPSDPLYSDIIEADLPTFKYTLKNAELTGLKDCHVSKLDFDEDSMTYIYFLQCPRVVITADHEAKGDIVGFSIDIKGKVTIIGEDYMYNFTGKVESRTGTDGKKYIQMKTHDINARANGKLEIDFKNDYDASTSDFATVQKFLNENWKDIDEQLRKPTVDNFMDLFLDNVNAYLDLVPFEPIVPDD
ncbi:uncharacterized protein LOC113505097 [Trichoplusia ni]|uniref:Uncharacterized protein LOC113505097 n=1 Tax=Trichoplusia ni TaxID=7111 RepID=A0A7E5WS24_TRINI|nr:uncharacterized protein LOC113505097 [Trichoplusia ni]